MEFGEVGNWKIGLLLKIKDLNRQLGIQDYEI
jgi:hypothetical protein